MFNVPDIAVCLLLVCFEDRNSWVFYFLAASYRLHHENGKIKKYGALRQWAGNLKHLNKEIMWLDATVFPATFLLKTYFRDT